MKEVYEPLSPKELYNIKLEELEFEANRRYLNALRKYGRYNNDTLTTEDKISKWFNQRKEALKKEYGVE